MAFDSVQYCKSGDAFQLYVTVQGVPLTQALTTAWLTLKKSLAQADNAADLQKVITTSASPGVGQITDDGDNATRKAQLRFDLTPTNTAAMIPGVEYYYDIQVKTNDATMNIYTVDSGLFHFDSAVTLSTS